MGRSSEPVEEWQDARDDDSAVLLDGCDALENLRALLLLLRQRRVITPAVHDEYRGCCDVVCRGLTIGRRNTALLRNRPPFDKEDNRC